MARSRPVTFGRHRAGVPDVSVPPGRMTMDHTRTTARTVRRGFLAGMMSAGALGAAAGRAFADINPAIPLRFAEFYAPTTTPLSLELSDRVKSASGQRVAIAGFVAPPLKPDIDFFVLTRRRLAVCPFCSSAADWPEDIVLVTLPPEMVIADAPTAAVRVTGVLEVGEAIDETTGFFSLLRLRAERIDLATA